MPPRRHRNAAADRPARSWPDGRPLTAALRVANEVAIQDVDGVLVTAVAPGSDVARQGVAAGDLLLQVGPNKVQDRPEELWREVEMRAMKARQFGLFMLLPKTPPAAVTQFPGPKWIALRIATE